VAYFFGATLYNDYVPVNDYNFATEFAIFLNSFSYFHWFSWWGNILRSPISGESVWGGIVRKGNDRIPRCV